MLRELQVMDIFNDTKSKARVDQRWREPTPPSVSVDTEGDRDAAPISSLALIIQG